MKTQRIRSIFEQHGRNDTGVVARKIVFTLLALVLIALPAAAQNQWLTSFADSVGPHVYYQAWSSPYDLWQIAPNYPWSGDMNQQLLVNVSVSGDPPPETWQGNGLLPPTSHYPSPLASFADWDGQHVVYIDNYSHPDGDPNRLPPHPHVRDIVANSYGISNVDLSFDSSSIPGFQEAGPYPSDPDGKSLTGFGDDRGSHFYYTGVDGDVHEFFWQANTTGIYNNDLTVMAGLTPSSTCGVVASGLTAFSDTRFSPNIELVYYVSGSGHLCELAWYQGFEQSYDLTALCVAPCGDGPPEPMPNSPLTGFTDAQGQHVFYLDDHSVSFTDGIHVHEFVAGPTGMSTLDLTRRSHGNWASPTSLTSFSNSFGPQVFYVDISSHVNQLNLKALTNQDLTASWGGAPCGTSLSGIGYDLYVGQVFYIGFDKHIWQLTSYDGSTWSPQDLTKRFGTPAAF
jgi:hypothetical protein